MAVLIEAISVVFRADVLLEKYWGGMSFDEFRERAPNQTLCADGELLRLGFMDPEDVETYVRQFRRFDIRYVVDGKARDLVVDQMRGPAAPCDWVECGHVNLGGDPAKRIMAARLRGSKVNQVVTPEGWKFERSLASSFGFVPDRAIEKTLDLIGNDEGFDTYRSKLTGGKVFVGRSRPR
jgi:hypothetical protein